MEVEKKDSVVVEKVEVSRKLPVQPVVVENKGLAKLEVEEALVK